MPELAEVELARRVLRDRLVDREVGFRLLDPRLVRAGEVPAALTVTAVLRRAKYLLVVSQRETLVLHLRMTGRLSGAEAGRVVLVFEPSGGPPFYLEDPRRLAELWVLPSSEVEGFFTARSLGDAPWPEVRPAAWWLERLGGVRSPVKIALLRQDRVAGLGNIAASEVLWRARVPPMRPARELSPAEWEAIGRHTVAHLDRLLDVEVGLDLTYVTRGGPNPFSVYGRAGAPCPRCGTAVARGVHGGRSTFWCPRCQ